MRCRAAHRAHAPFDRVVGARHVVHGAGLGLAVGDQDLREVHLRQHTVHHLDRARGAGHDAGAKRRQVELREARVIELRDEHRGHAVQRGAALGLNGLQRGERIEGLRRKDRRCTVRDARQAAHHHAEAVVERHGHAQAVVLRETHALADDLAVVEDVAVRQRRALGIAGGAAGELDVDRVGGAQLSGDALDARDVGRAHRAANRREIEHAGRLLLAHADHGPQVRQPVCIELSRRGAREFRRQRLQHAEVIAGPEALGRDQRLAPDLVQRVLELVQPVSGVDAHHDRADARARVLRQAPLDAVGRPDAEAIARRDAEHQQRGRQAVDLAPVLGVVPANALVTDHQRRPVGEARGGGDESLADGLLEQRPIIRAAAMAERERHGLSVPIRDCAVPRAGSCRSRSWAIPRRTRCGGGTCRAR